MLKKTFFAFIATAATTTTATVTEYLSVQAGLNFIDVLRTAFTLEDPESV